MANQRQGTHKSKERSEISGSTRKIGRQKGGGGARRGDMNSPVLVGGARAFGPKPRDYYFKLNKKVKTLARKSALSYKAQNDANIVVEDFTFVAVSYTHLVISRVVFLVLQNCLRLVTHLILLSFLK